MTSYIKEARKLTLSNFAKKSSLSAIYGFFIIVLLIGAYFIPLTLMLTVPLLGLPLTLGYITANASLNEKNMPANPYAIMFSMFVRYYHNAFFGCFRSLFGFIKVVVVYLIYSTIISFVITIILFNTSPEFAELINSTSAISIEQLEEVITKLQNEPLYTFGIYLSFTVGFGFACYTFFHHILTNSIKYFNLFRHPNLVHYREINATHRLAFKRIRKTFYFNYYQIATFMAVLFIGGYVAGSMVSYKYFTSNYISASVVGLFVGFLLNLFILPFLLDLIETIYSHVHMVYVEASLDMITKMFEQVKRSNEASPEDIAKVEELIKKQRENFEQKDKDENKDDENNKNSA